MKRFLFLFILLLRTASASALDIQTVETSSGIKALLVEDHSLPVISFSVQFENTGYLNDPRGKEGLVKLMTAMLDEGAGRYKSEAFQQMLFENSISLSFNAGEKTVSANMTTLSANKKTAFNLLRQALTSPRFDRGPLKRVRNAHLAMIEKEKERPTLRARRLYDSAAYSGCVYGRPSYGTETSLKKLKKKDLEAYRRQAFSKKNMLIGVVGDITPDDLSKFLEETFGSLPTYAALPPQPETSYQPHPEPLYTEDARMAQSVIVFGTIGIKRDDPDFYAAYVLNQAFGGSGLSSRLFDNLRKAQGLTYGARTSLSHDVLTPKWIGSVSTSPENVPLVLTQLKKEIDLLEKGLTKTELAESKRYLTQSFDSLLTTNDGRLGILMTILRDRLPLDYIETRKNLLNSVSEDDTMRVAKKLLKTPLTYIVLGR